MGSAGANRLGLSHGAALSALRKRLCIAHLPYNSWNGGELQGASPLQPGLHKPQLRVGKQGYELPTPLQTSEAGLYHTSFLHAGQPRVWVVVARRYAGLLEAALLRYFKLRTGQSVWSCTQWVRHSGVWAALGALRHWGVPYTVHTQHEGKLMVLAPGSYWQVWDTGACVSEKMCYADGASLTRAADCLACNDECRARALTAEIRTTLSWQHHAAFVHGLQAARPQQQQPVLLADVVPSLGGYRLPPVLESPWHKGDGPGGLQQLVDGAIVLRDMAPNFEIWQVSRAGPRSISWP